MVPPTHCTSPQEGGILRDYLILFMILIDMTIKEITNVKINRHYPFSLLIIDNTYTTYKQQHFPIYFSLGNCLCY